MKTPFAVSFGALNRLKSLFFISFLTALLFSNIAFSGPKPEYKFGQFPFFPRIVGLPQDEMLNTVIPGWLERARANIDLAADLYNDQKILESFPEWKMMLNEHPGYWPELVGKLGDQYFLRLFGPDIWRLKSGGYVVGEENGANVGGNETMMGVINEFRKHREWGAVPYNDDVFSRMADELRNTTGAKTIVYADEGSLRTEPFTNVGENKATVEMPFSIGTELHEMMIDVMGKAGITWVSLIDDRGRIFVENGILYLRDKDGQSKTRIDAIITAADIESIDPEHKPQWERNKRVHQEGLNNMALVLGIPGIVKAWVEAKDGGFVWMNNPTSVLTRSKLWPILVDEWIQKNTGRKPLLPVQKTIVFFDKNGNFQESALKLVSEQPENYVTKLTLGSGGKEVWIGSEFKPGEAEEFLKNKFEPWGRANPFSILAQPFTELDEIEITWPHDPTVKEKRTYDIRFIGLLGRHKDGSFVATMNRNTMIRFAKQGMKKVNISGGGMLGVSILKDIPNVVELPPLPSIGIREVGFPHTLSYADYMRISADAGYRALVEAYLVRDLYNNPEKLFERFPRLRHLVQDSVYFAPMHFKNRSTRYPTMFLSGPDYMQDTNGNYGALEHNTTNVGGLFRLWKKRDPLAIAEMKKWMQHLQSLTKVEKPYMIYFLEEIELGAPWAELREQFKKDFSIELVSVPEMNRLQVKDNHLLYRDDAGVEHTVSSMFLHIEPDLIDPDTLSFERLIGAVGKKRAHELRTHAIPGLGKVVQAGNLLVVNEPGQDIACSKAILPLMPELQKYYLGLDREVVPTLPSENFIDDNGKLRQDLFRRIAKNPAEEVIKNAEITGGGGGVHILRENSAVDIAKVFDEVRVHPEQFILQSAIDSPINAMGFHSEVRMISLVQIDMGSDKPPVLVGQVPVPYIRGATNMGRVNIIPTGNSAPGFAAPVRIANPCIKALK